MKAPKKIYVDSKAIGDGISTTVHTKRQDYPTSTEYTRTDAFVEKACEFLKKEVLDDYAGIVWERLIEDFKNYMKGK